MPCFDLGDHHGRLAGHGRMYRMLAQEPAVHPVAHIGRHRADDITRVYELQVHLQVARGKMRLHPIRQQSADIAQPDIARGVCASALLKEVAASAFSADDKRVSPVQQPPFHGHEQPVLSPLQDKGLLRNQEKVDLLHGQGWLGPR